MTKSNLDIVTIITVFFFFLSLVFFIVIALAVRYRKRKKENEQMKVQFSEQLLKSQLEIQEQTLQHVSRELHDNIGQMASLIKINLNTMQLQHAEAAEQKLTHTKELARQLITDLKLLSTSLNGDKMNKIGLMKALQNEADKINKTGVFNAKFTQHDAVPAVNHEKAIIIYRMVQEILNNALKHSEAKEMGINAYYQGNRFILVVTDDGKGFDAEEKLADINDSGNGLINLQKRARVINASIIFESAPGKGTSTTITTVL
jgi:two-component system, NarL family, sensor kinase